MSFTVIDWWKWFEKYNNSWQHLRLQCFQIFGAVVNHNNSEMTDMRCLSKLRIESNADKQQYQINKIRIFNIFDKLYFHAIRNKMLSARLDAYNVERTCRCCLRDLARLVPLNRPDEMIDASTIGDALMELTNVQVFSSSSVSSSTVFQSATIFSSIQTTACHRKCAENASPRWDRLSLSGKCARRMMRNCVNILDS